MPKLARAHGSLSKLLDKFVNAEDGASSLTTMMPLALRIADGGSVNLIAQSSILLSSELTVRDIERKVNRVAADVIGTTTFLNDEPLMDGSLDSTSVIEFRQQLLSELGGILRLSATLVFDYPTVREIRAHVLQEYEVLL